MYPSDRRSSEVVPATRRVEPSVDPRGLVARLGGVRASAPRESQVWTRRRLTDPRVIGLTGSGGSIAAQALAAAADRFDLQGLRIRGRTPWRTRRPPPREPATPHALNPSRATRRTPRPWRTRRPLPAGTGSVVNRCGGGWSGGGWSAGGRRAVRPRIPPPTGLGSPASRALSANAPPKSSPALLGEPSVVSIHGCSGPGGPGRRPHPPATGFLQRGLFAPARCRLQRSGLTRATAR